MIYVGIDVASWKHDCTIVTDQGEILIDGQSIGNDKEGFEELCAIIRAHDATGRQTEIGMEETGIYHERLRSHLLAQGYRVYTINPQLTAHSRRAGSLRRTKTDKVDALAIARYVMMYRGSLHSYTPSLYHLDALKASTRTYHGKRAQISRTKTELKRLLQTVFPEFSRFYDPLSAWALRLFKSYPTPVMIGRMHLATLARIIRVRGDRMRAARHLRQLAKDSVGRSDGLGAHLVRFAVADLEHYQAQLDTIKAELREAMADFPHITTIPGVGSVTGAIILAEIGDVHRFAHKSKLVAYAGIDAVIYESGKFRATHTGLSKRGSKYLRSAIFMAARAACIGKVRSNKFRTKYEAKLAQGKHHYTAVFAAAKNMVHTIYAILKSGQPFDYGK